MSAWRVVVAAAWLLGGGLAQNGPYVSVAVAVPAGPSIVFGAPFELEVHIDGPLPHVADAVKSFDPGCLLPAQLQLREQDWPPGTATRARATLRYTARLFASGEVTLPGPRVRVGGTESAGEPVKLTVRSILTEPPGDVEWPGDVRDLPGGARWPWFVAVLVLVGLGAARLLRRRTLPVEAPVASAPEPLLAEPVLAAIAALRIAERADAAAITAFYTALAEIVRGYAGRRFHVAAFVRTSPELLRSATAGGAALGQCLLACDLVKFAAVRPDAAAHEAARAAAAQFVREAAPDVAPVRGPGAP